MEDKRLVEWFENISAEIAALGARMKHLEDIIQRQASAITAGNHGRRFMNIMPRIRKGYPPPRLEFRQSQVGDAPAYVRMDAASISNGYACPYLTREAADVWMKNWLVETQEKGYYECTAVYDEAADCYRFHWRPLEKFMREGSETSETSETSEGEDWYDADTYEVLHLYRIGIWAWGWQCWQEVSKLLGFQFENGRNTPPDMIRPLKPRQT